MDETAWPEDIKDLQGYYYRRCRELNTANGRVADALPGGVVSWQAARDDAALYAEANRRWRLVPAADRLLAAITTDLAVQHSDDGRAQARLDLLAAVAAYEEKSGSHWGIRDSHLFPVLPAAG